MYFDKYDISYIRGLKWDISFVVSSENQVNPLENELELDNREAEQSGAWVYLNILIWLTI